MDSKILHIISVLADFITITGVIAAIRLAMHKRNENLFGFRISLFIHYLFKIAIILIISTILFRFSNDFYLLLLPLFKDSWGNNLYWEKGKEIHHILTYFVTAAIFLSIAWILVTYIWTSSMNTAKDYLNLFLPKNKFLVKRKPILEIMHATYGSTHNMINVTDILRQMVDKNALTITASNKLAGDPHPMVEKKLIISYRFGQKNCKAEVLENATITIPIKTHNNN